jgi:concentrative nucleoside transporter, CNT family
VIVLKTFVGKAVFATANDAVNQLLSFSTAGARFIFGNLVDNNVPVGRPLFSPAAFSPIEAGELVAATGTLFAFRVLPTILFFSALIALLYHLGVLQSVVRGIAWVMQKTLRTSGAESLSVASNIFLGQTESPLLVKPYLATMTRSELMAVMVAGFATVAGGVMAAYVGMLSSTFPDIAGHLLAASVMGAPASFVMAKIMVPETQVPVTSDARKIPMEQIDSNALDATARGTTEGLALALNVGAMLLVFIALIATLNALLGWSAGLVGIEGLSLERIFGWVGAPLAWILGVPWADAQAVGALIGTKTVVNEFVAYDQLASALHAHGFQQGRSVVIATYALCGFANFSSIGIQIGGIATMAPSRRGDIARLGMRAMICGSLATFQTAAIAGMFL